MSTKFHSKYWANLLTLRGTNGEIGTLTRSMSNLRVDLNPHQVDAALFALRSPFMNGAILADEVGLGKTIEAGIVISQRWAERRRKILIIVPAILRNQWQQELHEKFFIHAKVLDTKVFNEQKRQGNDNPFSDTDSVVICSYNFASAKNFEISSVDWDLVVIDEAHRLRNLYKTMSRRRRSTRRTMAQNIVEGITGVPKLLLTATPLQNSLLELYSLVNVVDEYTFGDLTSFRQQFVNVGRDAEDRRNKVLRARISSICTRTLRKQVTEYVPFTNRVPITQEFILSKKEDELYDLISNYLQRNNLYALPASQRQLITLILRKLLASSTFAIAHTLKKLADRLNRIGAGNQFFNDDDIDGIDALIEEQIEEESSADTEIEETEDPSSSNTNTSQQFDLEQIKAERDELLSYSEIAFNIVHNSKGEALLAALKTAFEKIKELGAAQKAVIFTESRQTQKYLYKLLSERGYAGKLVTINGSNTESQHREIYENWLQKNANTEKVSGSRDIDTKAALVDYFRERASILIATESAAEGVNLQFCSLVVNYDLPWNPQRIEQRIGRCHRYGQKHDVVVVNFVNRQNETDSHVFDLLSQKFRLFEGVLGASDEILGALESGVDIEKRIAAVYQNCRTSEEIQNAFDELQRELDERIQLRMKSTRKAVIENLDEEVRRKLKFSQEQTIDNMSQFNRCLLRLTQTELKNEAVFDPQFPRFSCYGQDASQRSYNLDWKAAEANRDVFYRVDHPLAQRIIKEALERELPVSGICIDYSNSPSKISVIERLVGKSGWLEAVKLTIESAEIYERIILTAQTEEGQYLDEDVCRKLLDVDACQDDFINGVSPELLTERQKRIDKQLEIIEKKNRQFFDEETKKIDKWSEDLRLSLEHEIKGLDQEIRDLKRSSTLAKKLQEKLDLQKQVRDTERLRREKRSALFNAQDDIERKRDELIEQIEKQLGQRVVIEPLFKLHWTVK